MPKGVYFPRSKDGEARRLASIPKGKDHWNFDSNPSRSAIHKWLKRYFGPANRCENVTCSGRGKKYDWALIKGKDYKRLRSCFMMLCRSCHVQYDRNWEKKS